MNNHADNHPSSLVGRLAAVTGASRGIGRACALALADAGADIALFARDAKALESVRAEIVARGREAHVFVRDVTNVQAVRADLEGLPALDILVNNAGTNAPQSFLDIDQATYDRVFEINVRSTLFIAQAAARRMVTAGKGVIINMSSQSGLVGLPERAVYCASKFAVEGMTRAMCVDLKNTGVRVNTVAPTFVRTEMTEAQLNRPEFRNYVDANIMLGRLAEMEDVAAAVVFLASDAASMITGATLPVDGGWTAH